jgi:DNA polymerase-3 subunit delta'
VPFREVILKHGHRRIVELLSRSVSRGTLPPSLIFAGPRGTGKRATALAVAQALNCLEIAPAPASGAVDAAESGSRPCASCSRIARGVHPDVLIVEPGDTGTIKIDQVRNLIERSSYRPFEGRRRVTIVDDADAMVLGAQNALLKTLEEPPPSSVFVLVTSRPDTLLPTLRSRCIQLTFAGEPAADMSEAARNIAERVLAQAASGSEAARLESARDLLTGTGGGGASDRAQVTAHLQAMASLLRDIQAIAAQADRAPASARDPASQVFQRLLGSYRGARGINAYAAVGDALAALEKNAAVKIVADWVVLQL